MATESDKNVIFEDEILQVHNWKSEENVFALPWNDSNMVLIVEGKKLHVHKWILTSQSPVFKAMFDGHFREASQNEITLKEKDLQSMIQFLKLLYPSSMFLESYTPLDDESRLAVMALADEYQCVNLIKQCIDEAEITAKNVLQVLPHAVKYHQTALPRMYDVIKSGVSTSKLEELLPKIESKKTSNTMLLTKCRFLESNLVQMQRAMISLLRDFLKEQSRANDLVESLKDALGEIKKLKPPILRSSPFSSVTSCGFSSNTSLQSLPKPTVLTADSQCFHRVEVGELSKIKSCLNCKEKYRQKFIVSIPSCENTNKFLEMLLNGDDVAHGIDLDEVLLSIGPKSSKELRAKYSFSTSTRWY